MRMRVSSGDGEEASRNLSGFEVLIYLCWVYVMRV